MFNLNESTSYPDDKFNRYWQPLEHESPVVLSHSNVTPSTFWNHPPSRLFDSAITSSRGESLKINWPPFSIPSYHYYVALYFHENRTPSPYSWRVFDVDINGKRFYSDLNVTTTGVTVYATEWPLGGDTEITLTPKSHMPVGPLINAAEILEIVPLSKKTLTRDGKLFKFFWSKRKKPLKNIAFKSLRVCMYCAVMGMNQLSSNIDNLPDDWSGDPCMPRDYSWTGVECKEGKAVRIFSL